MSRRVLVTCAADGASALADALLRHGLEPVVVPAIELTAPENPGLLRETLEHLETFDWLLFTSASGVRAFAAARDGRAALAALPGGLRIAAIGQATARAAQQAGLPVDLVPRLAVAEAMAEALRPFAHGGEDGRPAHMLLLRAEEGREVLPERLRAAGAKVSVVAAYRNVVPAGSVALLQALFAREAEPLAAITFTSASTIRNLLGLCEAAGVSLPAEALRVSIGPVTSEALRAVALPPDAEAPEATVLSLAETVWRLLRREDEG